MAQTHSVPQVFDRALLRARLSRAQKIGAEEFLLARVAEDMAERLHATLRDFAEAVDLGTPGTALGAALQARLPNLRTVPIPDDEHLDLAPQSQQLIVSALALQFVNDLPGVLAQIHAALKPDGLLLAAMIGGETLTELRQAFAAAEVEIEGGMSPHVAPLADLRDIGALLQRARFALPVADVDRVIVRYGNVFSLMQDLRRMGAGNILTQRRRTPLRRATLLRMAEIYAERFADPDGRIRATFDIVWLSGWSPHESQQQPLKPGSAKFSLEDAVKRRGGK
ncbi:MAG TPA: methyltransferase domain-containing protein [Xanthobacteraceae bacterium]|nr:methyltransferase domain-containing protein [Xanthobacteraceae bacterium]